MHAVFLYGFKRKHPDFENSTVIIITIILFVYSCLYSQKGAGIVSIVARAYLALVTVKVRRTVVPVWASRASASIRAGRMPVIFGTNLLLGSIQTGMVLVVVRVPPVHWAQH